MCTYVVWVILLQKVRNVWNLDFTFSDHTPYVSEIQTEFCLDFDLLWNLPRRSQSSGEANPRESISWGGKPWWVNLPGVRHPGESIYKRVKKTAESISQGSETPLSLSPQDQKPCWVNLPRIRHPAESIYPGSENLLSQFPRGQKPRWVSFPVPWFLPASISTGTSWDEKNPP